MTDSHTRGNERNPTDTESTDTEPTTATCVYCSAEAAVTATAENVFTGDTVDMPVCSDHYDAAELNDRCDVCGSPAATVMPIEGEEFPLEVCEDHYDPALELLEAELVGDR